MKFEIIETGYVYKTAIDCTDKVAVGSRCAVSSREEILCTFMIQKKLGGNDFKPVLCRSFDHGKTWTKPNLIWPDLQDKFSIFGSISKGTNGEYLFFGQRTVIDKVGESFWCEATSGLKANELIWAKSCDNGATWSKFTVIPMPVPGAAEAPGAMCVARDGSWYCCYSPYKTFNPDIAVKINQVIMLRSRDEGNTWEHKQMLTFDEPDSGGAESWITELGNSTLLGMSWHFNRTSGADYPNAYSLSFDGGSSWQPTQASGLKGQSLALTPVIDDYALVVYNQRKNPPIGIWLALLKSNRKEFLIDANEIIWTAAIPGRNNTDTDHRQWTNFAFGEPSVTMLQHNIILITFWCIQPDAQGIGFVKIRMK
ncbi:MAG: hypothetical protein A2Y13_02340 [Planctomycetes bacterium GWC2_45_44]|uniref:Putative sialidase n=1 Tax=candidate division CPR1 bacterium GW2011_GWA2_42_17 TaxID=1618341 RepID=A0A0G1BE99_9BACT|nr:MAG: putative sialidase [candidate division CPR1 bacterium GW2011_GWA2_42_17]OHB44059.1 MAG: hypothetical protein A2Y13_02340 [Planctomycetes bacterium GWC2_45_44]